MACIKSGMKDPKVKLLRYMDRVQGIMDGKFKPPIMADIDVVQGMCNLDCEWCCQKKSRDNKPVVLMSVDTMKQIGKFCKDWGVKSWRIAGDSEPTINKNLSILLQSGRDNGIEMGLITNGTLLDQIDNLQYLAWIGISLDAATPETWCGLKHSPESMYWKIIENIKKIHKNYPKIDITLKCVCYSMDDSQFSSKINEWIDNYDDIELLPGLAKKLGVNYHIVDAFPKTPKYKFDVCRATPLYATFGADHKFYICCDRRDMNIILTDDYTRDNWTELLKLWGSERHKKIISSIRPSDCEFCSKDWLNTVMENIIIDGKFTEEYQIDFI